MFKWFKNKKKDNKGFTLVELVIVIAILAILVGLLAPQYTKYVEKSRKAADASNMDEMVKVIKVYAADPANELAMGTYTITIGDTTTLAKDKAYITNETTGLTKEMNDSIPNWKATTVKSKKWGAKGVKDSIVAEVIVGKDGGTSVVYHLGSTTLGDGETVYKADKFSDYMKNGSETSN